MKEELFVYFHSYEHHTNSTHRKIQIALSSPENSVSQHPLTVFYGHPKQVVFGLEFKLLAGFFVDHHPTRLGFELDPR